MKQGARNCVIAAMVVCCALMPALPLLYANWSDRQLLGKDQHRPQVEGMLDEQVRNVPILYALFCQRYLTGSELPYVNPIDGQALPADEEAKKIVQQERVEHAIEKTQELIRAGALPQSLNEELEQHKQMEPIETAVNQEEGGFSSLRYSVAENGELQIRAHESTGLVTYCSCYGSFSIPPFQKETCKTMLNQYRDYLGLSMLQDWTELHGNSSEGLWSAMGQVYLFCSINDNDTNRHIEIGAYSLAPDQFLASPAEEP